MNAPFLSVVIPTRNRAALLREAIQSVLEQDYDDFEVVVSDNWNGEETAAVLREFVGHPRFRSVRTTSELNMPDHWHFASGQARGRYLLFLNDRMVMRAGVLRKAYESIVTYGYPVIVAWGSQPFTDNSHVLLPHGLPGTIENVPSERILRDIATNNRPQWWRLPRFVNGCVDTQTLGVLQARYGSIFRPISPDFTSGFILCARVPTVLCIGKPFYLSRGLATSTGLNTQKVRGGGYVESLRGADPSRLVPVKTFSVWNSVFSDYESMRAVVGGDFPAIPLDMPRYFAACLEELELIRRMTPDGSYDEAYAEWSRAFRQSGLSMSQVDAARQTPYGLRGRVRDAILRTRVARPFRAMKRSLVTLREQLAGVTYPSALDAARRTGALAD